MKNIVGTDKQKKFALDILHALASADAADFGVSDDVYAPVKRRAAFLLHIAEGKVADAEDVLKEIDPASLPFEMYYLGRKDPSARFGWREAAPERLEDAVVIADRVIGDLKGFYYKIKQ